MQARDERETGKVVGWGFGLALGAILIPLLAIPAFVLGIIAATRNRVGAGVAIMVLGLALGAFSFSVIANVVSDSPSSVVPQYVEPTAAPECSGYIPGTTAYEACVAYN